MAEKWRIEGTFFDACNCVTLCPCGYLQPPTFGDCRPTGAWHIERGNYGATTLNDLMVVGVFFAKGSPILVGVQKGAIILDEKASPAQREALRTIWGGQAGGLFAKLFRGLEEKLDVTYAKLDYVNDEREWSVKGGEVLEIRASFVKAPPGMPIESAPKRAQTYDVVFAPSGEKVVGVADLYRANIAGFTYDFSGRYSGAGRFAYDGP